MNTDQPKPLTPKVNRVEIHLCDPCLKGEGSECHTPGCAAFLHAVDLPFNEALYTIISPDRRAPENRETQLRAAWEEGFTYGEACGYAAGDQNSTYAYGGSAGQWTAGQTLRKRQSSWDASKTKAALAQQPGEKPGQSGEVPKLGHAATGFWWIKKHNEWFLANLHFDGRFLFGPGASQAGSYCVFSFETQADIDSLKWGGRVEQPRSRATQEKGAGDE